MQSRHKIRLALLTTVILIPNTIFSVVKEDYNFSFEVRNPTTKFSFIVLQVPKDVSKVAIEFRKIPQPILVMDYIAESTSEITAIKNRVYVRYHENETVVEFMDPAKYKEYYCESDEHGHFRRGACLRGIKLVLPPELLVTVFQNEFTVYSRADLLEIKKKQYPHLFSDNPATAKAKKQSTEAKLKELNSMLKKGLITKEEYAEKKKALLDAM